MKIVIDDKIPFIREPASKLFEEVVYIPGTEISAKNIKNADALIVRTRTHCNESLLAGSKIKLIITATIGYDHLDTSYLEKAGISWSNCPGCNASSVSQYVESVVLVLKHRGWLSPEQTTVGIVGAGHVGVNVASKLKNIGCTILFNDPPRQEKEGGNFHSLTELAEKCDLISFHTPLIKNGFFKTYHLADINFFKNLYKKPVILNAARGGIIDEKALLQAMDNGKIYETIIDTWENEPNISRELLHKVFIGTPHIAGYSADGKANATRMALSAVCTFFHITPNFTITAPSLPSDWIPSKNEEERKLQLYNPILDSEALKATPEKFEFLRGNYPLRREVWAQ